MYSQAVSLLIERHASGLVHLILSASPKYTLLASLSRPVAGTIGYTLIVTAPGSAKAVKENPKHLSAVCVVDRTLDIIGEGQERARTTLSPPP